MLNLNAVMISSEDPKPLVEFYTKVLGKPGWEDGDFTGWRAGGGTLMVGPHTEVKGPNEMPGRILIFFETPEVQKEFDRLKGQGVKVAHEPYEPGPGMTLATLEDPDGNYFQLASPMPEEMAQK
jgi:predicted enzyme related to lactoylglutathione lyase